MVVVQGTSQNLYQGSDQEFCASEPRPYILSYHHHLYGLSSGDWTLVSTAGSQPEGWGFNPQLPLACPLCVYVFQHSAIIN